MEEIKSADKLDQGEDLYRIDRFTESIASKNADVFDHTRINFLSTFE
jgi:hypothetical protein